MRLLLSVFPGIDLLGEGMRQEWPELCLVRGPDPIFGGDIRGWHVPAGMWYGVLGGPPCQAFSRLANLNKRCGVKTGNLIPEFERVVYEAQPAWFLMENVPDAPIPSVPGYETRAYLLNNRWVGGSQNRLRRFSFGTRDGRPLDIDVVLFENPEKTPAVTASAVVWVPLKLGGSGKVKSTYEQQHGGRPYGDRSERFFRHAVRAQGLPEGFDLPDFTVRGKIRAVGNGVPRELARAVAKAIRKAMGEPECPIRPEVQP